MADSRARVLSSQRDSPIASPSSHCSGDLCGIDESSLHDHMFWSYGRKILAAAAYVKDKPKLHIVYITNAPGSSGVADRKH